jgi:hypothetical protein
MKRKHRQHRASDVPKRTTTLTLPADSLTQTGRSEEILSAYTKAFAGFSDEEMLLLDGIVLEPPGECS